MPTIRRATPTRSKCRSRPPRRWCSRWASRCWRRAWRRAWRFCVVGGVLFVVGLGHVDRPTAARPRPRARAAASSRRCGRSRSCPRRAQSSDCSAGMPGYRLRLPTKVHPDFGRHQGRHRRRAGDAAAGDALRPASAATASGGRSICSPAWCCRASATMNVAELRAVSARRCFVLGIVDPRRRVADHGPDVRRADADAAEHSQAAGLGRAVDAAVVDGRELRGAGPVSIRRSARRIEWPWFVLSQFIFGVVAAIVFMRFESRSSLLAGLLGGIAGGLLMPVPALLWGIARGHGIWYPVNLLSAMAMRHAAALVDPRARTVPRRLVRRGDRHPRDASRSRLAWRSRWCCRGCRRFPARWPGAGC